MRAPANLILLNLCVQEEPVALGPYGPFTVCPHNGGGTKPAGEFRFTKFTQLADRGFELYDEAGIYLYGSLRVEDCEFWDGALELDGPGASTTVVRNNLFVRAPVDAVDNYFTYEGDYSLAFSNNLFWHVAFEVDQNSSGSGVFFNNDFDACSFSTGGSNASTTNGYNAYLNCSGRLYPTNTYDIVTNASLAYQTGPLGNFYQPTNSPLLDKGSTTAANAGLASYTTQTNEAADSGTVDIGYHYPLLANDSTGTDFWLAFMFLPPNISYPTRLSLCISSAAGADGTVNFPWLFTNSPTMIATNCGDASVNGTYVLTNLTLQERWDWNGTGTLNSMGASYVKGTNWANFSGSIWYLFGYDPGTRLFTYLYDKEGINLNGSAADWQPVNDETNSSPTTICMQYPFSEPFSVVAGGMTNINLNNINLTNVIISADDQVGTNGIHVTASAPVSVYALDYTVQGSAAFTCYPTPLLGTSYCLMSRPSFINPGQSEFAIVATADDTTVTITPSTNADLGGYLWANPIVLQQGQTYQIKSQYETNDVTGTRITADKPVAVFAGVDDAYVPDGYTGSGNPLVQEQLPVAMWGVQALSMGFAGRTNGDSYRVLAAYDNTVVWTNGVLVGVTNAGQYFDLIIDGPVWFQSTKPIQVAQFANGIDFDSSSGVIYGDPCEILLPPAGHYLQTNIVVTLTNDLPYQVIGDFDENYLNVIVPQSAITNTWLDGSLVATTKFVAIWTSGYYGAQLTMTNSGTHKVTSSQPVGVEVYGFGTFDAYGYFGGVTK